MLGKMLMEEGSGEIGLVWYFLFCRSRWVGCLVVGRGTDDGRLADSAYFIPYISCSIFSYMGVLAAGIRIQLTAGGWSWRGLAGGCCCEVVA